MSVILLTIIQSEAAITRIRFDWRDHNATRKPWIRTCQGCQSRPDFRIEVLTPLFILLSCSNDPRTIGKHVVKPAFIAQVKRAFTGTRKMATDMEPTRSFCQAVMRTMRTAKTGRNCKLHLVPSILCFVHIGVCHMCSIYTGAGE